MILKVSGISYFEQAAARDPQPQTKYYKPAAATKQNIKNDFEMVVDAKLKELHFEAIV